MNFEAIPKQQHEVVEEEKPYTFSIETPDQSLVYIGALHSFNPEHPQFQLIRDQWADFLTHHPETKKMALVEGGVRPVVEDEEETIKSQGEAGLVTKLAHDAGVAVESPEPNRSEELIELEQHFSADQIMLYYAARLIAQWHRYEEKPVDLEDYLRSAVERSSSGITYEQLDTASQRLLGRSIGEGDDEFWNRMADPTLEESPTNAVAASSSRFRDAHIVAAIAEQWKAGKDLFVVYGRNHALDQEGYLREALTDGQADKVS